MGLGTPYLVGTGTTNAGSSTTTITLTAGTQRGDAILVGATCNNTGVTVSSITDSRGNSYASVVSNASNFTAQVYAALNTAVLYAGDTITVNWSSTSNPKECAAVGAPGVAKVSATDAASAANSGSSTTPTVTTGTLAQHYELIFAVEANGNAGGAITWSAPMTQIASVNIGGNFFSGYAYDTVSATTAVTASGTITSTTWGIAAAALKAGPEIAPPLQRAVRAKRPVLPRRGAGHVRSGPGGPYPPLSSLVDPFNATSLNTGRWSQQTGGSATISYAATGVTVTFPASSTSATVGLVQSASSYSLAGSSAYLQVTGVPSAATHADAELLLLGGGGYYLRWVYEAGTLFAQYYLGGSVQTVTSFAYSSTTHRWWRIREAGGTVFWDTSADAATWTNRASLADPFPVGQVFAQVAGLCYENETNPGTFKFADFNFTVSAPFYPLNKPAKAKWQRLPGDPAGLPVIKGRTQGNAGAPVTTTPYVGRVWTGSSTYDYGLSTIAISNTPGTTLVLLAGWDLSTQATDAAMAAVYVNDSAGNYWFHAATTSSGVKGSRSAAWICPDARGATWLTVSATTFVSSLAYTVFEVANMPLYYSLDISDANATASAASLALAPGTTAQADAAFSVFTTGATGLSPATPSGWNALGTVTSGDGAANPVEIFPYWRTATVGTDLGATYSVASAVPVSGITFAVSLSPAAPVQPDANYPVLKVEAGFGFTPGDPSQPPLLDGGGGTGLGWTDITSRAMGKQGESYISAAMGRTYELSQMEAGELAIACDNHDGALTPGNTSSPYYPNVVVGTPVRVSAFWGTHWYHVGFGWVERWPQQWPDLPQWGMSAMIATDAVAVLSAASMPSALDADLLIDAPYAFIPGSEQYTTFVGGLNPVLVPADAQGLLAANISRTNQRAAMYVDGTAAACDTGQETSILGDSDSGFGTTSIADAPAIPASGPGVIYTDPAMPGPQSASGVSIEFWVIVPTATASGLQPTVFSAYGPASTYGTGDPSLSVRVNSFSGATMTITLADGSTVSAPFNAGSDAQQIVLTITSSSLAVYVNGGLAATQSLTAAQTTTWSAVSLGSPDYAYDAGAVKVGNFTIFDFAVYGYQLPVQRILSHYVTGFSGQQGSDATARLAQILSWANLGVARAGQVLFGDPPTADEVTEGPAYSIESASAADAVNQLVTNETGQAFATPAGGIQFVHRWALFNQAPVATFGDDPNAGDGEVPYLPAMSWDYDVTYLKNTNQVQQVIGPNTEITVTSSDFVSQASYFLRSVQTTQIETTSALDAYTQSQWQIAKYAQPQLRVAAVTVDAASNAAAAFPVVLPLQQGQVATTVRRPVGGAVISEPVIVEKITHDIGPAKWQTSMQLSPYTPEDAVLQLDASGFDVLGENTLA